MSRFFIERPVFAWVIAIVIMLAGVLSILTLADYAIPHYRAACRERHRGLSGRLGRDAAKFGDTSHRAATHRHRQSALFLFVEQFVGAGDHHRDLRSPAPIPTSRRSKCRTKCSRLSRACRRKCSSRGSRSSKSQSSLSADRGALRRQRPLYQCRHLRSSGEQAAGSAVAACRAWAMPRCSARTTRCASGSIPTSCRPTA